MLRRLDEWIACWCETRRVLRDLRAAGLEVTRGGDIREITGPARREDAARMVREDPEAYFLSTRSRERDDLSS